MKQYYEIVDVKARQITDEALRPGLEAEVTLDDGSVGRASVPASVRNSREAALAVENVNVEIAEALLAMNALDQTYLDRMLLELDGTETGERLGANAILASSLAIAKAAALSSGVALYNYIGGVNAKRLPAVRTEADASAVSLSDCATLSQFLDACALRRAEGKKLVLTAGESETEDNILADLAVALNAEELVTGSVRVRNQLLRIEEELYDGVDEAL